RLNDQHSAVGLDRALKIEAASDDGLLQHANRPWAAAYNRDAGTNGKRREGAPGLQPVAGLALAESDRPGASNGLRVVVLVAKERVPVAGPDHGRYVLVATQVDRAIEDQAVLENEPIVAATAIGVDRPVHLHGIQHGVETVGIVGCGETGSGRDERIRK